MITLLQFWAYWLKPSPKCVVCFCDCVQQRPWLLGILYLQVSQKWRLVVHPCILPSSNSGNRCDPQSQYLDNKLNFISASCSAVVSAESLSPITASSCPRRKPPFATMMAGVCLAPNVKASYLCLDFPSLGLLHVLKHTLLREELLLQPVVLEGSGIFCAGCIDTKMGTKVPLSSDLEQEPSNLACLSAPPEQACSNYHVAQNHRVN